MRKNKLVFALLAAALPFLTSANDASARTLETEYAITVRGFPVGRARLEAEFTDGRYSTVFSGRIAGLARLFSDAATTASAAGRIASDRLQPDEYKHVWTEDGDTETVTMQFSERSLTEMVLEPPRKRPERYVPLTAENKSDALDLVSAFIWPIPDDAVTPETCSRTLPLVDGRVRFDIVLSFKRMATIEIRDGSYSGRALVCGFRYRQVAGHRIGKKSDTSISDNEDMELWLVPVGGGFAVPARVQLRTRAGRIVLQAIAIHAD